MSTLTENVTNAVNRLDGATAAMLAATAKIELVSQQKGTEAQTVIYNFLRSTTVLLHVDPQSVLGGDDKNDGLSHERPVRSLEKALELAEGNGASIAGCAIFLLSDGATIARLRTFTAPLRIAGAAYGGGPLGSAYRPVVRTLGFLGEAVNSPFPGVGRTTPCLSMQAEYLRFSDISLMLPDTPAGLDSTNLVGMNNGGSVVMERCAIAAASAGAASRLFNSGAPGSYQIAATLGANASGKLFSGIAAGQNPNQNFNFRSNLTSA